MGANQSSNADGGSSVQGEVKTSYYELLGVTRQASEDEIKKAYRRKALELHPDRNYGNEDAATKTFAEVQAAYEVLSDPQERAWYDSHETAILRGEDGTGEGSEAPVFENIRITTADELARIPRKFTRNVEFSDSPSGFFGFLREIFEKLAKEEIVAANWENIEPPDFPSFGHKDDEYGDVVKRFYTAWSNFSTVKTFAWKDKYRLSEAPDRWYRRRMEQENKAIRQDARKEFNEAVRTLVAFVRKRDPRHVVSTQTEEERQKALRNAAASQSARARAANLANMSGEVAEWTKVREPEELEEEEEEEEEEQVVLECVACSKTFKSERQWEAHEKSKKHQKAMFALKRKMRKENAHLDLDSEGFSSGAKTPVAQDEDEQKLMADEFAEVKDHTARVDGQGPFQGNEDEHSGTEAAPYQDEESRKAPEKLKCSLDSNRDLNEVGSSDASDSSEDSDYTSAATIAARLQSSSLNGTISTTPSSVSETKDDDTKPPDIEKLNTDDSGDTEVQPTSRKLGKAAQKRAKKAAAASSEQQQTAASSHKCATCDAAFPSRTRLFQHIKDHGHAAFKSVSGGPKQSGKKKGKR